MVRIEIPIIVEGRYDKAKLRSVVEAVVITTDGFGVFSNAEKRALIRRLGERGIIILSDSDGGGRVIRSHLKGMLGGTVIYDLYIPRIKGKEARKASPSKEGYLGVEGIDADILREIFEKFALAHPELCGGESAGTEDSYEAVTPAELYELGLTGGEDSQARRDSVCVRAGLPAGMTAKGFREAVGLLRLGKKELKDFMQ